MDSTLRDLGGCGKFQVIMTILVFTSELASPFSLMFMSFGNYNPGWKCMDLDNSSSLVTLNENGSNYLLPALTTENDTSSKESDWITDTDRCPEYEACTNVKFNPESNTVVSEWRLICGNSWIPSTIISIQMVGVMIGAYFGGYLGDKFGRQRTICLNAGSNAILNLLAAFSVSWHMFAVFRFFIGITYASMISFPFVYASELTPSKWRSFLASIPAWNIGAALFAVLAMVLKDWKFIHLFTGAFTLSFFFPLLWIPESVRWLTVNGKVKKAVKVATQIAKMNKRPVPKRETFVMIAEQCKQNDGKARKYSWYDLWRKDVRLYTFIFGFIWISMAVVYYTTSFGAKNLVGDIYVNLIILYISEIPVSAVSTVAPNYLGRKKATLSLFVVSNIALFTMVFLDRFATTDDKGIAIFAMVILARFSIDGAWYVLYTLVAEIYPTVIRGTSLGYGSCMSRIGGIVAPYLISKSKDSNFVSFTIMACLMAACSILLIFLPETKGRALTETWSEEMLPCSPENPSEEDSSSSSGSSDDSLEKLKKSEEV